MEEDVDRLGSPVPDAHPTNANAAEGDVKNAEDGVKVEESSVGNWSIGRGGKLNDGGSWGFNPLRCGAHWWGEARLCERGGGYGGGANFEGEEGEAGEDGGEEMRNRKASNREEEYGVSESGRYSPIKSPGERSSDSATSKGKQKSKGKEKTKDGENVKEGILRKTMKHITSRISLAISGVNENWNNSVDFAEAEAYDDFEYGNMPLLLIDDPPEQNRRFSLYTDRRLSEKGTPSCCSCSCCCKCIIVGLAMIFFGCVGGLVGYIIACVFGQKGTLTTEPLYQAVSGAKPTT